MADAWRVLQGVGGMSVNEAVIFLADASEFSHATGEFIAKAVAQGDSVSDLHAAYDHVPSPIIVNRWRRRVPAFDLLMKEAEQAKAELLADGIIKIADNKELMPGQQNNAIKARQWLASKLHERYGSGEKTDGPRDVNLSLQLTDEQLMAIASGGLTAPDVIEGELADDTEQSRGADDAPAPAAEVGADEGAPEEEPVGSEAGGWP